MKLKPKSKKSSILKLILGIMKKKKKMKMTKASPQQKLIRTRAQLLMKKLLKIEIINQAQISKESSIDRIRYKRL